MVHGPSRRASLARCVAGATVLAVAPMRARPTTTPAPLRVVASFSLLADMLREIGGEALAVSALVGPGADAHVYEPSPRDVQRLAQADLVVVNGLRFEGWLERLVAISGYRGEVVVATRGIAARIVRGAPDPHAWQSLIHARVYVDNLRRALAATRPAQAAVFERGAADYLRRIDALDASTRSRLAGIAPAERRVVTTHDAFGYFADTYGVTFIAAQGWTTGAEPSAAAIADIVRTLRAQRVRALFVENIADPRLVQRIAGEVGARIGGTLYSDALSAPGTPADTYLHLFEHNVATIVAALRPAGSGVGRDSSG